MKYGYARVSTKGQDLKEQERKLVRAGAEKVVSEKVSGAIPAADRPAFRKLNKKLAGGDELIVTALDRLGRSGLDILRTVEDMKGRGVAVTIDGVGTIRDDVMGKLMVSLLACFADFERSTIIERMQGGRAAAIASGKKMGPRFKLSQTAREAIMRRYHEGQEPASALAEEYGVSRRTVVRLVGQRSVMQ